MNSPLPYPLIRSSSVDSLPSSACGAVIKGESRGAQPLWRGLQGVSPCLPNNFPGRAGGKNHALWQQRQQRGAGGTAPRPSSRRPCLPSATNPFVFSSQTLIIHLTRQGTSPALQFGLMPQASDCAGVPNSRLGGQAGRHLARPGLTADAIADNRMNSPLSHPLIRSLIR